MYWLWKDQLLMSSKKLSFSVQKIKMRVLQRITYLLNLRHVESKDVYKWKASDHNT